MHSSVIHVCCGKSIWPVMPGLETVVDKFLQIKTVNVIANIYKDAHGQEIKEFNGGRYLKFFSLLVAKKMC